MPSAALKHLAKKADIGMDRAEHLWDKAKGIVDKEYGKKHKGYWGLVMGITKKMMGLGEQVTFSEYMLLEGGRDGFWSKIFDRLPDGVDTSDMDELVDALLRTASRFEDFIRIYKTRQHQAEKDARAFAEREMAVA